MIQVNARGQPMDAELYRTRHHVSEPRQDMGRKTGRGRIRRERSAGAYATSDTTAALSRLAASRGLRRT